MSVYKNIDGTSKKSFRIGSKGAIISTGDSYVDERTGNALKGLLVDGKAVYTEGNVNEIFIDRGIIDSFTSNESGCKLILKYYVKETRSWRYEEIDIKTRSGDGGVYGPESSTADNIAVFSDSTGSTLKDSGFRVLSNILNSTDDSQEVMTFGAVKQYVEGKEVPLSERMTGKNAQFTSRI